MSRKKKYDAKRVILQPLSQEEIDRQLKEIGQLLRKRREPISALNDFCFDLDISHTSVGALEKHGANVNLSTFLQILHGLGIRYEDFIRLLKTKPADPNSSTATPTEL
jgi:hypothetical protein